MSGGSRPGRRRSPARSPAATELITDNAAPAHSEGGAAVRGLIAGRAAGRATKLGAQPTWARNQAGHEPSKATADQARPGPRRWLAAQSPRHPGFEILLNRIVEQSYLRAGGSQSARPQTLAPNPNGANVCAPKPSKTARLTRERAARTPTDPREPPTARSSPATAHPAPPAHTNPPPPPKSETHAPTPAETTRPQPTPWSREPADTHTATTRPTATRAAGDRAPPAPRSATAATKQQSAAAATNGRAR